MTDEEKKATEILKEIKDVRGIRQDVEGENEDLCALDIVYKLIKKQQKEIEELRQYKESLEGLKSKNKSIIDNNELRLFLKRDYISKDKIRDILNYLNDTDLNNYEIVMAFRKMMKELLEDDGDHIPRID